MKVRAISLEQINIDGGTQQRAAIDQEHVEELAEVLKAGVELPPGRVYQDGSTYWLSRGFHRYHAHRTAGRSSMSVEVYSGTLRDAILDAVGDNADHGLKRSNADKRKAVLTLLKDEKWGAWSDNEIARRCHVSPPLVAKLREALTINIYSDNPAGAIKKRVFTSKHGKSTEMKTGGIGKRKDPAKPAPEKAESTPPKPDIPVLDELEAATCDRAADTMQGMPWEGYNSTIDRIIALLQEAKELTLGLADSKGTDRAFTGWIDAKRYRIFFDGAISTMAGQRVVNWASQAEAAKLEGGRNFLYACEVRKRKRGVA